MAEDPLWAATMPTTADPAAPAVSTDATAHGSDRVGDASAAPVDDTPVAGVQVVVGPRRRWPRRVRRALVALAALGATYYGICLYQVWATGRSDQARDVDVIVVLGAAQYDGRPSPQLRARLDHAVDLYRSGYAPYVFVTGGKQPGDRFTEAEASVRYLLDQGVDEAAILREDLGGSTWESLENVAADLTARGAETVLLVTDPFHSLRSRLVAEELSLRAYVSPTPTTTVTGSAAIGKELKEAAGVAVGRIVGFERLFGWTG